MNCSMSTIVTPRLARAFDALEHEVDDEWREPERHLVGDDQSRWHCQGAGEREHLLLATRERARALAASIGEHREHLVGVCHRGLALISAPDPADGHPQVLLHRQAGKDAPTFGDVDETLAADLVRDATW